MGAEVGLYTSSWERLGTCRYATEPTQRRDGLSTDVADAAAWRGVGAW